MTDRLIERHFYETDAVTLAVRCLGKRLVVRTEAGLLTGIITETEAYCGITDRASHAFGGRRTARTETMYLPGGYAYVYLIYGMYACFNITASVRDDPQAVLVRGLMPTEGLSLFYENYRRNTRARKTALPPPEKLANGPGKLCCVTGITTAWNGISLTDTAESVPGICLIGDTDAPNAAYVASPRIGIDYAGEDRDKPWRFTLCTQ